MNEHMDAPSVARDMIADNGRREHLSRR